MSSSPSLQHKQLSTARVRVSHARCETVWTHTSPRAAARLAAKTHDFDTSWADSLSMVVTHSSICIARRMPTAAGSWGGRACGGLTGWLQKGWGEEGGRQHTSTHMLVGLRLALLRLVVTPDDRIKGLRRALCTKQAAICLAMHRKKTCHT